LCEFATCALTQLQLPDPSQPWGCSPSAPVPCWKKCGTAGAARNTEAEAVTVSEQFYVPIIKNYAKNG
jgi:hypothetical protein